MRVSVWEVLGIAETTDERAIKRAYAAKLRIHSPEADPAGYMTLREAYEAAKRYAEAMREHPGATDSPGLLLSQPVIPAATETTPPSPSPQQQALAGLKSLLSEQELDEFVQKVDHVRGSGIFVTLDEQQDFIGEVALLVRDAQVQDLEWCASLAARLGAREYENIFEPGTEYWHAYQELLNAHHAVLEMEARTRVQQADEIAQTPGYLHVYHVLTAPFDSERMIALTRSQSYYRLVEALLERAKKDSSIVIPQENREWWERTAMAGLHRPMADPAPAQAPAPASSSGGNSLWFLWPLFMLLIFGARSCGNGSTYTSSNDSQRMQEIRELASGQIPAGPPSTTELILAENSPIVRLSGCDANTRRELISHIHRVPRGSEELAHSAARNGQLRWKLVLDESEPEVAALLAKCASNPAK
jgi:hypothetical protein